MRRNANDSESSWSALQISENCCILDNLFFMYTFFPLFFFFLPHLHSIAAFSAHQDFCLFSYSTLEWECFKHFSPSEKKKCYQLIHRKLWLHMILSLLKHKEIQHGIYWIYWIGCSSCIPWVVTNKFSLNSQILNVIWGRILWVSKRQSYINSCYDVHFCTFKTGFKKKKELIMHHSRKNKTENECFL